MRYNVDCPHCGKPRSLSDSALWPDDGGAPSYPEASEPQPCLDCPGWMRVVLVGDEVTVEKSDPPPWHRLEVAAAKARVVASRVGPMHAAWDDISDAEALLATPYAIPSETIDRLASELEKFG